MLRDYSRYPDGYRKRLTHVPHGFDQKQPTLSKAEARRQFGLAPDAVLLGSVARLHPLKHLDAAIRVLPQRPDWTLALAGQGPDEARLRELAAISSASPSGCTSSVRSRPTQVANFLACLDVFVFPVARRNLRPRRGRGRSCRRAGGGERSAGAARSAVVSGRSRPRSSSMPATPPRLPRRSPACSTTGARRAAPPRRRRPEDALFGRRDGRRICPPHRGGDLSQDPRAGNGP